MAAADIVQRAGAKEFDFGFVDDDPLNPRWYCSAIYQGARVICDEQQTPENAADGLARKLLDGGGCTHCGKPVALSGQGVGICRWTRMGRRWERGCVDEIEQRPKIGRNSPCPCGSGKKFKHCHITGPQPPP